MKINNAAIAAALVASSLDMTQTAKAGDQQGFWHEYTYQVERRGQSIFADRFYSPGAVLSLTLVEQHDGYAYWDTVTSSGRSAFVSTFKDALRESAVGMLPRDKWADYGNDALGSFFGHLFIGSFANTAEEDTPAVQASLSYSAVEARQYAVAEAHEDRPVQYGIRLWDEYAYTSLVFGHINREPIVLSLRARSSTDLNNLGMPVIEGNLSFVLFDDCHIVMGGSIRPTKFDSKTEGPQMSVMLERATGIGGLAWYAGGVIGPDGRISYSAGLSAPW